MFALIVIVSLQWPMGQLICRKNGLDNMAQGDHIKIVEVSSVCSAPVIGCVRE